MHVRSPFIIMTAVWAGMLFGCDRMPLSASKKDSEAAGAAASTAASTSTSTAVQKAKTSGSSDGLASTSQAIATATVTAIATAIRTGNDSGDDVGDQQDDGTGTQTATGTKTGTGLGGGPFTTEQLQALIATPDGKKSVMTALQSPLIKGLLTTNGLGLFANNPELLITLASNKAFAPVITSVLSALGGSLKTNGLGAGTSTSDAIGPVNGIGQGISTDGRINFGQP